MKRLINKYIFTGAMSLAMLGALTSCEDWNQTESLEITNPNIKEQNPEMYQAYLKSLKEYKASEHKIMYVGYDNTIKNPVSIADHMALVPDSVDIVALSHPDELNEREVKEMGELHDKGTKLVYMIDFDAAKANYQTYLTQWEEEHTQTEPAATSTRTEENPEAEEPQTFIENMNEYLAAQLAIFDKYAYDGVTLRYITNTIPLYLYGEKLEKFTNEQNAFLQAFADFKTAHPEAMLIFQGAAKEVLNTDFFAAYEYIILDTTYELSIAAVQEQLNLSMRAGVPTDRFIGAASTPSMDVTDVSTGYFFDNSDDKKMRSIPEIAYWTYEATPGAQKIGMAIYDVQRDYYHTSDPYMYTRQAIDIMNPSPKK